MIRVTVTLDDELLDAIDKSMKRRGYSTRSEIFRDLLRYAVTEEQPRNEANATCLALLSFVVDQTVRDLPERIAMFQRDHHDILTSQMQVQLDHDSALCTYVLQGASGPVERAANELLAQRGIRHGRLSVIPSRIHNTRHRHGRGHVTHSHVHVLS